MSEANYYKVQYGMDEAAVVELLGPSDGEKGEDYREDLPAATAPASADRKTKTWSRGGLRLSVVFERGRVVSRHADGIPHEDRKPLQSPAPPPAATPATSAAAPPLSLLTPAG